MRVLIVEDESLIAEALTEAIDKRSRSIARRAASSSVDFKALASRIARPLLASLDQDCGCDAGQDETDPSCPLSFSKARTPAARAKASSSIASS